MAATYYQNPFAPYAKPCININFIYYLVYRYVCIYLFIYLHTGLQTCHKDLAEKPVHQLKLQTRDVKTIKCHSKHILREEYNFKRGFVLLKRVFYENVLRL